MIIGLDHIQLAMPKGGEEAARGFYGALLGLGEVAKPPELAVRGGVWFSFGCVQVHLGVEDKFKPAKKAHPAFRVVDLEGLCARLAAAGVDVARERGSAYVYDPFGNRVELVPVTRVGDRDSRSHRT